MCESRCQRQVDGQNQNGNGAKFQSSGTIGPPLCFDAMVQTSFVILSILKDSQEFRARTMDSVMLHKCFQGGESEATTPTPVNEEVGGSKGMSLTKRGGWVAESKAEDGSRGDEEKEDSGKIAPDEKIMGRQNSEQAGEDFRDSTTEVEIVKNQQSFEEQIAAGEKSEGDITESQTKRMLEEKASVSYSFPFG